MKATQRYEIRIGSGKMKGKLAIQALCDGHAKEWRKDSVLTAISDDHSPCYGRKVGDECEICSEEDKGATEWLQEPLNGWSNHATKFINTALEADEEHWKDAAQLAFKPDWLDGELLTPEHVISQQSVDDLAAQMKTSTSMMFLAILQDCDWRELAAAWLESPAEDWCANRTFEIGSQFIPMKKPDNYKPTK